MEWSQINNEISLAFIILPKTSFLFDGILGTYGIMYGGGTVAVSRTRREPEQEQKTERTTQQSRRGGNRKT